MRSVQIYDTTLRDGAQGEGVNFSLQDKLLLTRKLDELGVDYVEGGYPLSNPKDFEYFQAVRELPLRHAKVVAFGMTRRKNAPPETDTCLKALLDARTPVVTIVGKTWDFHVTNVLGTTLDENLRMIADSVAYCRAQGREVFYDAEHFFDGYRANPEYALRTLRAAADSDVLIVGMNYYDPFLAAWIYGPQGQALALASLPLTIQFNAALQSVYQALQVPVADVAKAFRITNTTPVWGIPLNVLLALSWTWMGAPPPVGPDVHPNAIGYAVIAGSFVRAIENP